MYDTQHRLYCTNCVTDSNDLRISRMICLQNQYLHISSELISETLFLTNHSGIHIVRDHIVIQRTFLQDYPNLFWIKISKERRISIVWIGSD